MKHQENKIDLTLSLSLFFWKEILVSLNSNESSNECLVYLNVPFFLQEEK